MCSPLSCERVPFFCCPALPCHVQAASVWACARSKTNGYDDVVGKLAHQLALEDPNKIRLTQHNHYNQAPRPAPIRFRSMELTEMLVQYQQPTDILYFEVLDIPLPELEALKSLKIYFYSQRSDEETGLNIRLPKESNVGQLLQEVKQRVQGQLSRPEASLRLMEIYGSKIFKILHSGEPIDTINDNYWIVKAEEVPVEEEEAAPESRLVHVAHFSTHTVNQVIYHFGEPFLLSVSPIETLGEVKQRIQKKLRITPEEFAKWKFARLHSMGKTEYFEDDKEVLAPLFQHREMFGFSEHILGLEHVDSHPQIRRHAQNQKFLPPIESSLAGNVEAAVAQHVAAQFHSIVKPAIKDSIHSVFESSVIPAFDIACRSMFQQMEAALRQGLSEHSMAASQKLTSPFATVQEQLAVAMKELADLKEELSESQKTIVRLVDQAVAGASRGSASAAMAAEQAKNKVGPTKELTRLVTLSKFEEAFTTALSQSDVRILSWLCEQVDLTQVFPNGTTLLSQGVLLSLVQQLGCDLGHKTEHKLLWLGHVVVVLDPSHPQVAPHTKTILQQLHQNLQRFLPHCSDTTMSNEIRLVSHIVNSLLVSCK